MKTDLQHERLKTARVAKGYATAKKFANDHKIPYETYIAHENGKVKLSEKAAKKYSSALGIPLDWLLSGKTEELSPGNLTTSIHIRRRLFEKTILAKTVESILDALGKKDESVDFDALFNKSYIITSEILSKIENLNDAETYIKTIITLSEKDLKENIIVKKNK